jgi:hypothetical protein
VPLPGRTGDAKASQQDLCHIGKSNRLPRADVVMGTRGLGTVTQLLLGSVSHKAIHQMDPHIPVTLVKAGYELPVLRRQPARGETS